MRQFLLLLFLLQGETTLEDCLVSLNVLCYILFTMAKLMAPFTPFLAEYMYQILRKLMPQSSSPSEHELSVHFQMIPKSQFVFFLFI
jgi:isoleucyl-tRNA synthetase